MFGQFGHFYRFARQDCDHPYPLNRYTQEVKRLLGVLETRLATRAYLVDEYTIADMATFPWVETLSAVYEAGDYLELSQYQRTQAWLQRCLQRPAVQRGLQVCTLES